MIFQLSGMYAALDCTPSRILSASGPRPSILRQAEAQGPRHIMRLAGGLAGPANDKHVIRKCGAIWSGPVNAICGDQDEIQLVSQIRRAKAIANDRIGARLRSIICSKNHSAHDAREAV